MTATDPDTYRCSICGHMFVVPTLARLCEKIGRASCRERVLRLV